MSADLKIQLDKAHKDLAALKAEYDEFVYIVSHDLSGPLRQIEGFAEIVVSKHVDSFDDKTKHHFELIQGGSNQAKLIIEALRNYSRLNTMAQPFTVINLSEVVATVQNKLLAEFNNNNITFSVDNLPIIVGEEKQISQVFEHLIHNALLYQAPERACHISICSIEHVDSWQFCLTDNGMGVAEKMQEKIFKVLKRGVSGKKFPGIGMGLAIVKKVLQFHQGHIWVESTENGSTFNFTIAKDLADE
jgi:light-regulated signal transduction histidine kinase (bacteriophytochrome)